MVIVQGPAPEIAMLPAATGTAFAVAVVKPATRLVAFCGALQPAGTSSETEPVVIPPVGAV